MKGIELPINTLVIVVLVLVVLIAVIALYLGVWNPSSRGVTLEVAKTSACHMLVSLGCNDVKQIEVRDFDADKDGTLNEGVGATGTDSLTDCKSGNNTFGDNLAMLCLCWYLIDETKCKELCGC